MFWNKVDDVVKTLNTMSKRLDGLQKKHELQEKRLTAKLDSVIVEKSRASRIKERLDSLLS